jgi:hypothetical protein
MSEHIEPVKKLFMICFVLSLGICGAKPGSLPDIYSTDYWEIAGKTGYVTWVEIHNSQEAGTGGIAHVSVMTRKKSAPVWEPEWLCPHIAITTEALQHSVIRPFKTRGTYPERFKEAYARWKEDEKNGTALICTTSIQDFLRAHP